MLRLGRSRRNWRPNLFRHLHHFLGIGGRGGRIAHSFGSDCTISGRSWGFSFGGCRRSLDSLRRCAVSSGASRTLDRNRSRVRSAAVFGGRRRHGKGGTLFLRFVRRNEPVMEIGQTIQQIEGAGIVGNTIGIGETGEVKDFSPRSIGVFVAENRFVQLRNGSRVGPDTTLLQNPPFELNIGGFPIVHEPDHSTPVEAKTTKDYRFETFSAVGIVSRELSGS